MGKIRQARDPRIGWHPAVVKALKLDLEPFSDALEFYTEFPLTTEPLRIDLVVIKKTKDAVIEKNIAAIFRTHNLIEYKSPGDYVSVEDFYKVYAYACLYLCIKKLEVTDLSVSFVESRRPRKLLAHLRQVRGYRVEEKSPGVYIVKGDIFAIQIINSGALPGAENFWLKGLAEGLGSEAVGVMLKEGRKRPKSPEMEAYLAAVFRANQQTFLEVLKMRKGAMTLDDAFVELGFTARWEAWGEKKGEIKGKKEGKLEVAQNMIARGWSQKEVSETTGLDIKTVRGLCRTTRK
jgi:hypothetical protein